MTVVTAPHPVSSSGRKRSAPRGRASPQSAPGSHRRGHGTTRRSGREREASWWSSFRNISRMLDMSTYACDPVVPGIGSNETLPGEPRMNRPVLLLFFPLLSAVPALAQTQFPLDPLTGDEIVAAVAILRGAGKAS